MISTWVWQFLRLFFYCKSLFRDIFLCVNFVREEVINQKWLCPFTCQKQMPHQQVLFHRRHRLQPWQHHNHKIPRRPHQRLRWVQWTVNIWCKHSVKLSIDILVQEVGGVFLYVNRQRSLRVTTSIFFVNVAFAILEEFLCVS